jgi:hypothetical protein
VYVFSGTEDFNESYITDGAAVSKETRFLKELLNTSSSVNLSGSEFMHISHIYFMVKSGGEQKRTREVPTQTKFVKSSRSGNMQMFEIL